MLLLLLVLLERASGWFNYGKNCCKEVGGQIGNYINQELLLLFSFFFWGGGVVKQLHRWAQFVVFSACSRIFHETGSAFSGFFSDGYSLVRWATSGHLAAFLRWRREGECGDRRRGPFLTHCYIFESGRVAIRVGLVRDMVNHHWLTTPLWSSTLFGWAQKFANELSPFCII